MRGDTASNGGSEQVMVHANGGLNGSASLYHQENNHSHGESRITEKINPFNNNNNSNSNLGHATLPNKYHSVALGSPAQNTAFNTMDGFAHG